MSAEEIPESLWKVRTLAQNEVDAAQNHLERTREEFSRNQERVIFSERTLQLRLLALQQVDNLIKEAEEKK